MVKQSKHESEEHKLVYAEDFEEISLFETILLFTFDPVWYKFLLIASFLDNVFMVHYILLMKQFRSYLFTYDDELEEKIQVAHITFTILYLMDIVSSIWTQHIKKIGLQYANPTIRPLWMMGLEIISILSLPQYTEDIYAVRILLILRFLKEIRILHHFHRMRRMLTPKVSTCILEHTYYMIMLLYLFFALLSTYYCFFYSICELDYQSYCNILSLAGRTLFGDSYSFEGHGTLELNTTMRFIIGPVLCIVTKILVDYPLRCYIIFSIICLYKGKYKYVDMINFFRRYVIKSFGLRHESANVIMKYFDARWQNRAIHLKYLPMYLPYSWTIALCMDFSKNAFKHSHIFRDLDVDFLRFVSTFMVRSFHLEGEHIYQRGVRKDKMVYIASGSISILSTLNDKSPLMTLTEGSCLGESTLLFPYVSPYSFCCKTIVVIYTLSRNDFVAITKSYPSVVRNISMNLLRRYSEAKALLTMKMAQNSEGHLIHLKNNLHRLMSVNDKLRRSHMIQNMNLSLTINNLSYVQTFFTKEYLDLLVIQERTEDNVDLVFLKSTCCWILRPNSPLLLLWEHIIIIVCFICTFVVPYYCAVDRTEFCKYVIYFIYSVWVLDLLILIITPMSDKTDAKRSSDVVIERMASLTFLLDFFAACPTAVLETIVPFDSMVRYVECTKLLKLYRIRKMLQKWENRFNANFMFEEIFKFVCWYIILSYYIWCFSHLFIQQHGPGLFVVNYFTYPGYVLLDLAHTATLASLFVLFLFDNYDYIAKSLLMAAYLLHDTEMKMKIRTINVIYTHAMKNIKNRSVLNRLASFLRTQMAANEGILVIANCNTYFNLPLIYARIVARDVELKILKQIELFELIPLEILEEIACICVVKPFHSQMHLLTHGIRYEDVYFLMMGEANTYIGGEIFKTNCNVPLNLLELSYNMPCVINIITVTDVLIISFNYNEFIKILRKYPEECLIFLKVLKPSDDMGRALLNVSKLSKRVAEFRTKMYSFQVFPQHIRYNEYLKYDYLRPFQRLNRFAFLRCFLMKTTIVPNGKFMFYWELFRSIFAYCYAVCYLTVPLATCRFDSYYCFIPIILTLTAIADIYVRLHACYFDEKGIMISHPLQTAKYYLQHAFIIDLIGVIPFEVLAFTTLGNPVYLSIAKCLPLYRFIGFKATLKRSMFIGVIYITLWYILLMFVMAHILFLIDCTPLEGRFTCKIPTDDYNGEFHYYLFIVTSTITGSGVNIVNSGESCPATYLVGFLAHACVFINVYFKGYIFNTCCNSNKRLHAFRRRLDKLLIFLKSNRCGQNFEKEVTHFYDLYWQWMGVNPFFMYRNLNIGLRMDLLYSLYGESLRIYSPLSINTIRLILFYKQLLLEMTPFSVCTNGYIITINDIEDTIYFISSGSVDVVAPDGTIICTLKQSSIFGNLLNMERARLKVSIVSNTPTKLFRIKTIQFYKILADYSDIKSNFEILRITTTYYIQSNAPQNLCTPPLNTPAYFRQVKIYNLFQYYRLFHMVTSCHFGILVECFYIATSYMESWIIISLYMCDTIHFIHEIVKYFVGYIDYNENRLIYDRKKIRQRLNSKCTLLITLISSLPIDLLLIIGLPHDYKYISSIFRINRFLRIYYAAHIFLTKYRRYSISKGYCIINSLYLFLYHFTITIFTLTMISSVWKYYEFSNRGDAAGFSVELYFICFQLVSSTEYKLYPKFLYLNVFTFIIMFIYEAIIFSHIFHIISTRLCVWIYRRKYINEALIFKRWIISSIIKRAWRKHIEIQWEVKFNKSTSILQMYSAKYLESAIYYCLYGYLFKSNPIFRNTHIDFQRQVMEHVTSTFYPNRVMVISKNDMRSSIYFLHKGNVVVYSENEDGIPVKVNMLRVGDSFGIAQGVFPKTKHDFNYMAVGYCEIIELQLEKWAYLLDFFPASKETIYSIAELYIGADSCPPHYYPKAKRNFCNK